MFKTQWVALVGRELSSLSKGTYEGMDHALYTPPAAIFPAAPSLQICNLWWQFV